MRWFGWASGVTRTEYPYPGRRVAGRVILKPNELLPMSPDRTVTHVPGLDRDRAATATERCLRYFVTFACYGARLHGDESGSVDRHHNLVGSGLLEPDAQRLMAESREIFQDPYVLDQAGRAVVLAAIQRHCCARPV